MTTSDGDLILRYAAGDADALHELVQRYEGPLYAYLVRFTGDRDGAYDVFQEAFLRVAREAARFDAKRPFKPWLYSIATRLAIDGHRKQSSRREVSLDGNVEDGGSGVLIGASDGGRGPSELAEHGEDIERLYAALGRLTEVERVVVLMHFREGVTLPEISEALSIPLGTVKSRLHAGITRLAKLMRLRADGWRKSAEVGEVKTEGGV